MNKQEAIELIERMSMAFVPTDQYGDYDDPEPYEEAVNMAIEALSAESYGCHCQKSIDQKEKTNYEGAEKDIVLSIPVNTIEMKVCLTMYDNGEIVKAEQVLDMESIKECEQLFEDTISGEYPVYTFTEKGLKEFEKYFD